MTATKVGAGSFVKVAQRLEAKMMLPFYLVLVTVLFPPPAAGQSRSFTVELDVTVRADCSPAKRRPNWIACFNAIKAAASLQEHNCTII